MRLQTLVLSGLLALSQLSSSSAAQTGPTAVAQANITTTSGNVLRLTRPVLLQESSSTAPGYVIGRGPYVTNTSGMEHLPLEFAWGTAFVPFHLIKRVSRVPSSDKSAYRVRVVMVDDVTIEADLGLLARYSPGLGSEAAFGVTKVSWDEIGELAFEGQGKTSRTISKPKGKPGGPYVVTSGSDTIELSTLSSSVTWSSVGTSLSEVDLRVGGVSFKPDFAKITNIDLTFTRDPANGSLAYSFDVGLDSGEKLTERGSGMKGGPQLVGESRLGPVLINFSRNPIQIRRPAK